MEATSVFEGAIKEGSYKFVDAKGEKKARVSFILESNDGKSYPFVLFDKRAVAFNKSLLEAASAGEKIWVEGKSEPKEYKGKTYDQFYGFKFGKLEQESFVDTLRVDVAKRDAVMKYFEASKKELEAEDDYEYMLREEGDAEVVDAKKVWEKAQTELFDAENGLKELGISLDDLKTIKYGDRVALETEYAKENKVDLRDWESLMVGTQIEDVYGNRFLISQLDEKSAKYGVPLKENDTDLFVVVVKVKDNVRLFEGEDVTESRGVIYDDYIKVKTVDFVDFTEAVSVRESIESRLAVIPEQKTVFIESEKKREEPVVDATVVSDDQVDEKEDFKIKAFGVDAFNDEFGKFFQCMVNIVGPPAVAAGKYISVKVKDLASGKSKAEELKILDFDDNGIRGVDFKGNERVINITAPIKLLYSPGIDPGQKYRMISGPDGGASSSIIENVEVKQIEIGQKYYANAVFYRDDNGFLGLTQKEMEKEILRKLVFGESVNGTWTRMVSGLKQKLEGSLSLVQDQTGRQVTSIVQNEKDLVLRDVVQIGVNGEKIPVAVTREINAKMLANKEGVKVSFGDAGELGVACVNSKGEKITLSGQTGVGFLSIDEKAKAVVFTPVRQQEAVFKPSLVEDAVVINQPEIKTKEAKKVNQGEGEKKEGKVKSSVRLVSVL